MRIILLFIIKIYWLIIPKSKRRRCLFKTSCSNHVYNKAKSEGLISGLKTLIFRMENCRPDYKIMLINNEKVMISANEVIFKEEYLSDIILRQKL